MARRKISATLSRSTQTPRRNLARNGVGGTDPRQAAGQAAGGGFWKGLPGSGGEGDSNFPTPARKKAVAQGQPAGADPYTPGVGHLLRQMGLGGPGLHVGTGFGFDAEQKAAIDTELMRIRQYMADHENQHLRDQLALGQGGIAGNLMQWERQLGMHPHDIGPQGATQQQQNMFSSALQYRNNGWGGGGGGWGGGGGGGGGQQQPPPGSNPPANPHDPANANQFPGYYSPGNPHQPAPPADPNQFPGYYSPGNPHQGVGGAPPGYAAPAPQQAAPQGYAPQQQGVMPPFAQAAPTQASPMGMGGDTTPATYGPTQQLAFQPLQLPNWNQFAQGGYSELPQAPPGLTGQAFTQEQAYMNQLRNGLAGLQGQYGQIAPQVNQQALQMQNDYGLAHQQAAEDLASRGIFDSGVARDTFQTQQADANRQLQALLQAGQGQVSDLYGQAGGLFDQTNQNLLDLFAQDTANQAANPNAPYQSHKKKPTPKRKKK